jgi:excisionase family DNA binding protein
MLTVKQAAKKLKLSPVRVYQLLETGRIVGATRFGNAWVIPDNPIIDPPLKANHRRKGHP